MRCEQIMKANVECVSAETTASEAARKMRDRKCGFLPVCDGERVVEGTITDRDLAIRVLAEGKSGDTPISEVMSRDVVSCQPEDDISRAQELLARHQKSRIMCVDNEMRLVGVISLSDLAGVAKDKDVARAYRSVARREARADGQAH